MEKELGKDTQTLVIGGQEVELKPLTVGQYSELTKFARRLPIRDFLDMAKECELDSQTVSATIKDLHKEQNAKTDEDVLNDVSTNGQFVLQVFRLRTGLPADVINNLPLNELEANAEAIFDLSTADDSKKK